MYKYDDDDDDDDSGGESVDVGTDIDLSRLANYRKCMYADVVYVGGWREREQFRSMWV